MFLETIVSGVVMTALMCRVEGGVPFSARFSFRSRANFRLRLRSPNPLNLNGSFPK